jgi:hypothetical protein
MAPQQAMPDRGMDIVLIIGMGMVVAMVGGPPYRTPLHGGGTKKGKYQLGRAGGLESAMGKIAVVESCDGKHAQYIKRDREGNGGWAPTHPNHAQTGGMEKHEWQGAEPIDPSRRLASCQLICCRFGIEPAHQGCQPSAMWMRFIGHIGLCIDELGHFQVCVSPSLGDFLDLPHIVALTSQQL